MLTELEEKSVLQVDVVVPVTPADTTVGDLLLTLLGCPLVSKVVLVGEYPLSATPDVRVVYIPSRLARAARLNQGASLATSPFIWFLHADTEIPGTCLNALRGILESPSSPALYFFPIRFSGTSFRMRVTEWGVRLRSGLFRLPFGDQGFLMSQDVFKALGPFDERVPYGEDHLLVWRAHHRRIPLRSIPAWITTSSRKYEQGGWARVTGSHLWKTWCQAAPQLLILIRSRLNWFA